MLVLLVLLAGEREVNVMARDLLIILEVEQNIMEIIMWVMVLKSVIRKGI